MSVQAGGPMCSLSNVWIGFWHLCGQQATASLTVLNLSRVCTQSGSASRIALLLSVLSLILCSLHELLSFNTFISHTLSCISLFLSLVWAGRSHIGHMSKINSCFSVEECWRVNREKITNSVVQTMNRIETRTLTQIRTRT